MKKNDKMSGKSRRSFIMELLTKSTEPITGQTLAKKTGVSRQVIVTDIALLRTGEEPIIATNRGYVLQQKEPQKNEYEKVIVCKHIPGETKKELQAIVDCGVTVVNVIVEHPLYGDLTGSLMLSSRYDVERFMNTWTEEEAMLLSVLTDGIHLHTLRADSHDKIEAACLALDNIGILVTENEPNQ